MKIKKRCDWAETYEEYIPYHDSEWGVPVYNDKKLFEFLILEGAQAGLSWITILKKREGYRKAFANYDVNKISRFNKNKVKSLMKNENIVRNRLKIESTITNAKAFIKIQKEFGSFSKYQWSFVKGKPIQNHRKKISDIPAQTEISDAFSKDLKLRGFKFVGSTIIYAHMQAVGMVNDHLTNCFCYKKCKPK